jgi:hypothetical protein
LSLPKTLNYSCNAVGDDVKTAADELLDGVTQAMVEQMAASGPRDWANASFVIAESAQTKQRVWKDRF